MERPEFGSATVQVWAKNYAEEQAEAAARMERIFAMYGSSAKTSSAIVQQPDTKPWLECFRWLRKRLH